MSIVRAAILDASGDEILIPDVVLHVVNKQELRLEGAFQATEALTAAFDTRGKYRITLEDGRTSECVIEAVQDHPDGTVTFCLRVDARDSLEAFEFLDDE